MQKSLYPSAVLALFTTMSLAAQSYPEEGISNGLIRAKLYLPDSQQGSYQGTRFDWAGIIYKLEYKGHEFVDKWYERHDPKIHDAITGPVEEFLTNNAGLGYDLAKPGGTFVRIGAGMVRKPAGETEYRRFGLYDIVDPGKRTVKKTADSIEFTHELNGKDGYSYNYRKTVRLEKGKPELALEHSLQNTGQKPIETSVYNHNFFVIDNEVVGPDMTVTFPFEARGTADLKGLAEVHGRNIVYLRELEKGQTVSTPVEGFGATSKDYDIRIENRKSGAGVRIRGDQPIEKVFFWSIRTVACPEPYIHFTVEPGRTFEWRISYEFYAVDGR